MAVINPLLPYDPNQESNVLNIPPVPPDVLAPPEEATILKEQEEKEKKRSEEAQEVVDTLESADGSQYISQYGRFKSIIDLSDATQDQNGVWTGARYKVQPAKEFNQERHNNPITYYMPANTLDLLRKEGERRDKIVQKSGDVTYSDAKDLRGKYIHGETTDVIRQLEDTVYNQITRGVYSAAPVAAGRAAFLATPFFPPRLRFGVGLAGFAGGLAAMEVWTPDMAEEIHKNQMDEIAEKEKNGYYVDKNPPRVLTVDQIRERLDPKYASFYTKTINTLAENVPASALIFTVGGGLYPVDKAINIMTGGRLGKSANALKKAELYFKEQNKALVKAGGVALPAPTRAELTYRAGIILRQELKADTENMKTGVMRFIYGFNTNQKIEQMRNPLNYLINFGVSELGGSGMQAFAAYSDFFLTGGLETQTLDKVPYAIGGAILMPNIVGKLVKGARNIAGLLAYVATTPAAAFQSKDLTNAFINPAINKQVFDWISGKNAQLPEGIDGTTSDELFRLREQLARYDTETGGQIIDNLRVTTATVQEVDQIIKNSGNQELIDSWDPRQAIGVLTQLDIIKAVENQYLINRLAGKTPTMDNIDPAFNDIQDARGQVLRNGEALLKILLDGDLTAFSNKPMYQKYVTHLSTVIADTKANAEVLQNLSDTAIAYKFSSAITDLMVTAEKEGLSPVTLEKHKFIESIIDDNPDFAKTFTITDEFTGEVKRGVEAVKAYKESIQLSISEIYENSKRANVELDTLYNKGKGNAENIKKYRVETANNGTTQASNYYAHTNMNRVERVSKTNRNNYKKVGKNKEDGFVDVTDMYSAIQDKVKIAEKGNTPGISSAQAADDLSTIRNTINMYFSTAVKSSVDEWFTNYGPGNSAKGYKAYKKILKSTNKELHASLPPFTNKEDLADWMIKNQDNLPREFKITATLGDVQSINDKVKGRSFNSYGVDKKYKPNLRNRLKQSETGQTWAEIKEITNATYINKLSKVDQKKLEAANNNFRDVVIPMRGTSIYANSHGTIQNVNVKSITGFNHGPNNNPSLWLEKVFKQLQNQDTATVFWNDFVNFYGPAEINGVRNHEYHNALTSISDYLQFRVHAASEGVLFKSAPDGKSFKTLNINPDKTSPEFIDQLEVMKPGAEPVVDSDFIKPLKIETQIVDGQPTYSSPFAHDQSFTAIQNLEKASNGQFSQNLGYDSVKHMHKIVSEGGAGAKLIKDVVQKTTKNIKIAQDTNVKAKAAFKANADVIQEVLGVAFKNRGSTGDITQALLENPENYDILIDKLDMSSAGDKINSRGLLQYIITDGLIQLSKSNIEKVATGYGVQKIIAQSDGMVLKEYFDNHGNFLKKVFDKEHFETFEKINNYLLRFVTDSTGKMSNYKFTRPDGLNIQYSNTKIMNRIWTTQIGKVNPSFLGIEAAASLLFNTNSNAFGALMLNKYVASEFYDFLVTGRLPVHILNTNVVSYLDQWAAITNGLFSAGTNLTYNQSISEDEHKRRIFNKAFNIKANDPNQMEKWQRYKDNVGGNVVIQSKDFLLDNATKAYDYIDEQMDMLF